MPRVLAIEITLTIAGADTTYRATVWVTRDVMFSALAVLLLVSVNPPESCCASAQEPSGDRLCHKYMWEAQYYKRVYYGHYDRQPFDYRFQFDYPSAAGPSQAYWPIPPLAAGGAAPWNEVDYEARHCPRVNIAARPAESSSLGTSLKLRKQ